MIPLLGTHARRIVTGLCLVIGALAPQASPGCATYDIEPDEPCRQAGFSIASRTFACTGDDSLANNRYERFRAAFRCTAPAATPDTFYCSNSLGDRGCERVLADGEDLEAWLADAAGCADILVRADGSPLPVAATAADTLDADPRCTRIVEAVAVARTSCAPETATTFAVARDQARMRLDAAYACLSPAEEQLLPDSPPDPEARLALCLDAIRLAGTTADAQACLDGTDAFYAALVAGCERTFLKARP